MHSFLHKTRHFMLICARKHQKLRFTCRAAGFSTARTNNTKGETCMSKSWKTRWCSLLLVLSMLAGLCAPVYAAPEPDSPVSSDTGVNDNIVIDPSIRGYWGIRLRGGVDRSAQTCQHGQNQKQAAPACFPTFTHTCFPFRVVCSGGRKTCRTTGKTELLVFTSTNQHKVAGFM